MVVRLDGPLFLAVRVSFEKSALCYLGKEKQTTENNVGSIFSLT